MEKGKIDFAHFSPKNPKANWTLDAVNTKTTHSNPYKFRQTEKQRHGLQKETTGNTAMLI